MTETIPGLGRIRSDLVAAIAQDRSRSIRRRKLRLTAVVAVVALGAVGSAIAAATGAFSPAPAAIQDSFANLGGHLGDRQGPDVDASKAIEIGGVDGKPIYAAPTEDGGFCVSENPAQVGACGSNGEEAIAIALQPGADRSLLVGRVSASAAATVEISADGLDEALIVPVQAEGFFAAELPGTEPPAQLEVVARNAAGEILARTP